MQKQPSNLSPITTTNMITTTAAIRTASMQRLLHRYAKSSSAGNIQRRGTTLQRVANRGRIEPPSAPKKKQHRSNLVLLNHPSHVVPSELFGRDDLQSKFDVYDCAKCFVDHTSHFSPVTFISFILHCRGHHLHHYQTTHCWKCIGIDS